MGVVSKPELAARVPGAPGPQLRWEPVRSGEEGMAKGRRRFSRTARTKARGAQHVCAYPRKAPGCASWGQGRLQKLSHMPFHSPHRPLLFPGTLSSQRDRCIWPCPARTEARSGARTAGVTCWESFQLLRAIPHPQGPASGRGQLGAPRLPLLAFPRRPLLRQLPQLRLRARPSPRLVRPTPGPHWQPESPPSRVFPKAPSSRAPARAAPPAPLPPWDAAPPRDPLERGARTFRGCGRGATRPGPQLPSRRLVPGG